MKVQVGHPVELPCAARGVPEPSLAWLKEGAALQAEGGRYSVSSDGSLGLGQVRVEDEGVYTCLASNLAGQDQANTQLLVQGGCPHCADCLHIYITFTFSHLADALIQSDFSKYRDVPPRGK